ncbi:MAG TPA: TolC family protein [Kofleriaceae bacterium]|jgi:outer membrane protein TolC
MIRWIAAVAAIGVGGTARAQPADEPAPAPTIVQPDVSDPMLAPPEAAPQEIKSWDDALAMLRRAPDYLTSVDAVERAIGQRRIALAAVLPTLTGQGSYQHSFNTESIPFGGATLVEPPPTIWAATIGASWNIVNPRGIYGVGTADIAIDVANLSLADRRRVLAQTVTSAMLDTLAAERAAEIDRVGLRAALERLVLTQTRLKFARGTELDVDRAQQDVAAARATLISGDESLRRAREALGEALGSATPIGATPSLDLDGFEQAIAQTCKLGSDIEQRADVVAARQRVSIADRQIKDAELMLAPSLAVGTEGGYASAVTLGPLWTWSVGATLTIPFYDGGARYGAMRDARAAADQARQSLAALRIDALIETARTNRAVGVSTAERDVAKQQRDLAQVVDQRVRQGYMQGLGTSLDLVTSGQALRQAELNLALLEFQLAQARAGAILVDAECVF